MHLPVRIKFVGLRPSEPLREAVHAEAVKIDRFRSLFQDCEVSLESWCLHHGKGTQYRVAIELDLGNPPMTVSRSSAIDAPRAELLTALHEAFAALVRRLEAVQPTAQAAAL